MKEFNSFTIETGGNHVHHLLHRLTSLPGGAAGRGLGMTRPAAKEVLASHRFLDEEGDAAFSRKGRLLAIGKHGTSLTFSLGMVKFIRVSIQLAGS